MPQRLNVDYTSVINSLKLSAETVPNELKLVYLFEIIVACLFNDDADTKFLKVADIQNTLNQYYRVIGILHNFRNDFVHLGFLVSRKAYLQLEHNFIKDIEDLAREFDVELNWDRTLYSKGE